MAFLDFLFGSGDKYKKHETGSPEQTAFHSSLMQQLQQSLQGGGGYNQAQGYLNSLLNPGSGAYEQFSQPYLQQFNEQVLPGIAERFAGGGALSSSGFGQALGGAGAGLQSQLAQLFSQLQGNAAQQQLGNFSNLTQLGLGYKPFDYEKQEGSAGFFGPALGAFGTALGGPLGGLAAGAIGSGISTLFKGKNQQNPAQNTNPLASTFSNMNTGFSLPAFMQR